MITVIPVPLLPPAVLFAAFLRGKACHGCGLGAAIR